MFKNSKIARMKLERKEKLHETNNYLEICEWKSIKNSWRQQETDRRDTINYAITDDGNTVYWYDSANDEFIILPEAVQDSVLYEQPEADKWGM